VPQIPPEAAHRLLEQARVGRLATLDARGRPTLVPIVYALIGAELWSPIDGKPKRGGELARVRNIRRDPRVSVLIDAWDEDWQRLWWIQLRGEARVERPDAAALAALVARYPQYATVPTSDGSDRMLAIRIDGRTSWCASPAAYALSSA
jgi:PPOX class probable F420-dependent enzyme